MRRSVRFVAGALVVTGICLARPGLAGTELTDYVPSGISGEGSAMFGAPDGRTGAMSQSIPIKLPAARGLPQPKLALSYDSSTTDREAGYGWGLGLPLIERRPLSGFPQFDAGGVPEGSERYTFSGQLLVRICNVTECPAEPNIDDHPQWAKSGGWVYYRLQVDGSSTRFYRSSDYRTWRMLRAGGERLEFGTLRDVGVASDVVAYESNVAGQAGIIRWRLAAQIDPQRPENIVVYRWRHASPSRDHDPLYLTDIHYTPPVGGVSDVQQYAHHVQLDRDSPAYSQAAYVGPEHSRLPVRLRRVAVASARWGSAAGERRRMVRAYHLTYYADRAQAYVAGAMAPLFQHSFLREVQVQGTCEEALEDAQGAIPAVACRTLPPMTFEYEPGIFDFELATGTELVGPRETLLEAPENAQKILPFPQSAVVVDFNRDGLPDVVQGWEPGCLPRVQGSVQKDCTHSDVALGMKVAITPEGEPQLWCFYRYADDSPTECGVSVDQYRVRSARPIVGYLNRGPSPSALLSLQYQCMDAGNGGAGTIPAINDGTTTNEFVRFLVPGGATVFAGAGSAVAFWQKDNYWPIVARPLVQPGFPPGSEPSNSALGGCFLDDRFDKNNFFPRWSWETNVGGTDFPRASPATPAVPTDPTANEPGWIVDVDGYPLLEPALSTSVSS